MLEMLTTEKRNGNTMELDILSTGELLHVMSDEDQKVSLAVREQIPQIRKAVEYIVEALKTGGRLIYLGAGTSGRIGLLDAVECPPTFGTNPEVVKGIMAGGDKAFIKAVEGAEDNKELAVEDLQGISLNSGDVLVGLAASGRTPYVIAGLEYAKRINVTCISISCNENSLIGKVADVCIELNVGPEVLTGSTRLKAGTAQKMVCNMLTTAPMVGLGKVYQNLMVDLNPSNEKLMHRARKIIMDATSCDYRTAGEYLVLANNNPKIAIVMILTGDDYDSSVDRLERADGFVRKALG